MDQLLKPEELFDFDRRTGIGINPDRLSAEEGLIYGATFLALKPEVAFYAEVVIPDDGDWTMLQRIKSVPFGGEGRRVRLEIRDEVYSWPEPVSAHGNQKPLLLLTTPGLFAAGWRPAAIEGRLLAAAVPGSAAVSGWDLARGGPKPNRFAAQAGSTYFPERTASPVARNLERQRPRCTTRLGLLLERSVD
jgi:CRISPR-associated protein Cmr3